MELRIISIPKANVLKIAHKKMQASFYYTHLGKRSNNQDALYIDGQGVYIVCDGVGGSINGHLAATFVADTLGKQLSELPNVNAEQLSIILKQTEKQLLSYLMQQQSVGASTTLALIVELNNKLIIAHCGDSKVMVYREKQKIFETRSHTYVNFLVKKKIITNQEALTHPQKNKITRFVDGVNPAVLDITQIECQRNDIFILFTDGVEEGIDIHELLSNSDNVTEINETIIAACTLKSNDNFTFILKKVQ